MTNLAPSQCAECYGTEITTGPDPRGAMTYTPIVELCPKHQAAEELRSALQGVGEQRGSDLCWCKAWSLNQEDHDQPCKAACIALTKAGARP